MQDWSGRSKTQLRAVNLKSLRAVERKPSPLSSCCRHSETVAKKRQRAEEWLKSTWHCDRRSSQQDPVVWRRTRSSWAEHSELRGEDSSPQRDTKKKPTNPGTESSSFCLFSQVFSSRSSFSCTNQRRRSERQDLPFCLASIPSASLPGGVLRLQRSRRGRNPRVSFSHFLGKSESLPSIQPDQSFLKMVEH